MAPRYGKQHHEDFARILGRVKRTGAHERQRVLWWEVETLFKKDNPLFDVTRFEDAIEEEFRHDTTDGYDGPVRTEEEA